MNAKRFLNRREALKTLALSSGGALLGLSAWADEYRLITHQEYHQPTEKRLHARIGYLPFVDHTLALVAYKLFAKQFKYLDLELVKYLNPVKVMQDLQEEKISGCFNFFPYIFQAFQENRYAKVVLLAHRNGSTFFVRSTIEKPSDLKGTLIAVPSKSSIYHVLLYKYLRDNGLDDKKDVTILFMTFSDMAASFRRNELDGFLCADPVSAQLEQERLGRILTFSHDIWNNHLDCAILLHDRTLREYPDATAEFVDAVHKAAQYCDDQRNKVAHIIAPYMAVPTPIVERSLLYPINRIVFKDLHCHPDEFRQLQRYLLEMHIIEHDAPLSQIIADFSFSLR